MRVHSVHLMNVEQRQAAADPQTKPPDLGCESACRLLSSTSTVTIYYYYSARKLILINYGSRTIFQINGNICKIFPAPYI